MARYIRCCGNVLLLLSYPSHNFLPLAGACLRPLCHCGQVVSRTYLVQYAAGEEVGHRLWLPAVAIHRLGVVKIAPSLHHCFRTADSCAQSVKSSPTEPIISRSSRQRLGHPPPSPCGISMVSHASFRYAMPASDFPNTSGNTHHLPSSNRQHSQEIDSMTYSLVMHYCCAHAQCI